MRVRRPIRIKLHGKTRHGNNGQLLLPATLGIGALDAATIL
jgi:hypothetical protein